MSKGDISASRVFRERQSRRMFEDIKRMKVSCAETYEELEALHREVLLVKKHWVILKLSTSSKKTALPNTGCITDSPQLTWTGLIFLGMEHRLYSTWSHKGRSPHWLETCKASIRTSWAESLCYRFKSGSTPLECANLASTYWSCKFQHRLRSFRQAMISDGCVLWAWNLKYIFRRSSVFWEHFQQGLAEGGDSDLTRCESVSIADVFLSWRLCNRTVEYSIVSKGHHFRIVLYDQMRWS